MKGVRTEGVRRGVLPSGAAPVGLVVSIRSMGLMGPGTAGDGRGRSGMRRFRGDAVMRPDSGWCECVAWDWGKREASRIARRRRCPAITTAMMSHHGGYNRYDVTSLRFISAFR